MIHVLTSPDVVTFEYIDKDWSPMAILKKVASCVTPQFHALIDPGALITGMSNCEVARVLLEVSLLTYLVFTLVALFLLVKCV